MSSILLNSAQNANNRQYDNETMLPEKENLVVDNKQQTQSSQNSEFYNNNIHPTGYREYNSSTANKIICQNNFTPSSMSILQSNGYTSKTQSTSNTSSSLESNPNSFSAIPTNQHTHNLPVVHAYANAYANSITNLNYQNNPNSMHHDRYFINHLNDRTSTYSNYSRLDNSNNMTGSNSDQNVTQSLMRRDTEMERYIFQITL